MAEIHFRPYIRTPVLPMKLLMSIAVSLAVAYVTPASLKDSQVQPEKESSPSERAIRQWVRQLGDQDFQVREMATQALIKAGPYAIEAVREAARSSDAEVRRRALEIAKQIEDGSAKALEALGASVQRGSDGVIRVVSFSRQGPNRLADADLMHLLLCPDWRTSSWRAPR